MICDYCANNRRTINRDGVEYIECMNINLGIMTEFPMTSMKKRMSCPRFSGTSGVYRRKAEPSQPMTMRDAIHMDCVRKESKRKGGAR